MTVAAFFSPLAVETISNMPDEKTGNAKPMASSVEPLQHMKHCGIDGPATIEGMAACPCCNRQLKEGRQVVREIRICNTENSLFNDDTSDSSEDMDDDDHMMPGILADGIAYTIKRVLVQGWVHKKGTGMDWLGSRAWKPRWAVLALGSIAGHDVDVPLLQIFWYSDSSNPSTVIHLDSSVVMPEDDPDKSKWNCFRFAIRHVKKSLDDSSIQITRKFSCPREGRDAWMGAISQALLDYEKEKAKARKQRSWPSSPPRHITPSWVRSDSLPKGMESTTSPRSKLMKRPVPRPEQSPSEPPFFDEASSNEAADEAFLMEPIGEAFLDDTELLTDESFSD